MKLAWWIALVLMLIGFAILFRPPRIDETMAVPVEPAAHNAKSPTTATELAPALDVAVSTEPNTPRVERSALAVAAPVREGPRTIVTGRCVDERAHALADVDVSLETVGERWSATVSAPYAIVDDRPQFEFHARSDGEGRFRFDVPQPDATSILLVATPGPNRLVLRRTLDHVIGPGIVDLKDLCCAAGGSIEGTVRSNTGGPLAGVVVRAMLGDVALESETDADGRYALAHLGPGRWLMNARSWCYTFAEERSLDIAAGGDPASIDFVAEPAPFLEGRVVDENEQPLPSATVTVLGPREHGFSADTVSTAVDGTFKMCLRTHRSGPLVLAVRHLACVQTDEARTFEPNTRDIVVVMRRMPRMTFRVVDSDTGAPVVRYRIQVVTPPGSHEMDYWTEETDHERGETELDANGKDAFVLVIAENRARFGAAVEPDEPGGHVQTLRLSPEASIVGRAMIAGAPAAGIQVDASLARPAGPDRDEQNARNLKGSARRRGDERAVPFDGYRQMRARTTEADGRFRFDELSAGTWIVTLRGTGIASRLLPKIDVAAGTNADIGDVHLDSGASIEGRVLLPKGLDPRYVRVTVDAGKINVNADEHGAYRFVGLQAGHHRVETRLNTHLGLDGRFSEIDLAADEKRQLDFDLRDAMLARVHVRVVRNGAPMASGHALVESSSEQSATARVGLDAAGSADLFAPPRTCFFVAVDDGDRIVARSDEMTLSPGERAEIEIRVDPGRLEVVLPERIQPRGLLTVVMDQGGRGQTLQVIAPQANIRPRLEWSSSHVELGPFAPGIYSVVAFQGNDAASSAFRFEGTVTIDAGRTSVVDFSDK